MYISTLLPILLCPCPAPPLSSPPLPSAPLSSLPLPSPSLLPPPVPPQSSAWMQRSTLMTTLRIVTPASMNCVTGPRRTTERWRQPRQGLTTLGWMGTLVALVRVITRVVMCTHTHTHAQLLLQCSCTQRVIPSIQYVVRGMVHNAYHMRATHHTHTHNHRMLLQLLF